MIIREMQPSDLNFAVKCTATEGWGSETRQEFESFLQHSQTTCFIAEENRSNIGICLATNYGNDGFIGELIVVKEQRNRGIGRQLLGHAITSLHNTGVDNIMLDGVVKAVPLYEQIGFQKVCRSLRFTGKIQGKHHEQVRAMRKDDLNAVCAIDQQAFGTDRRFLLTYRLSQYPALCKVLEYDGEITSFVTGRYGDEMITVGPWCARPNAKHPERLLEAIAATSDERRLNLGILETNKEAIETVRSLGFTELSAPPWRMVLGSSGILGFSRQSFAIASPAMG